MITRPDPRPWTGGCASVTDAEVEGYFVGPANRAGLQHFPEVLDQLGQLGIIELELLDDRLHLRETAPAFVRAPQIQRAPNEMMMTQAMLKPPDTGRS